MRKDRLYREIDNRSKLNYFLASLKKKKKNKATPTKIYHSIKNSPYLYIHKEKS